MTETLLVQEGYKYRIYPSHTQAEKLRQVMGTRRFVYNHFLAERQTTTKKQANPSVMKLVRMCFLLLSKNSHG